MGFVRRSTRVDGQNKENGNIAALLSRVILQQIVSGDNAAQQTAPSLSAIN